VRATETARLIANFFAPRIAASQNVFGLALIPLSVVIVIFFVLAKDAPRREPVKTAREYFAAVAHSDTAWFCFFYSVTFGGYVGLSSFLPVFLRDQFSITPVMAGSVTAIAALAGSLSRPLGGWIADRVGGGRVLQNLFVAIAVAYALVATLPAFRVTIPLVVITMMCLGLGNGVVFQLVPQRSGARSAASPASSERSAASAASCCRRFSATSGSTAVPTRQPFSHSPSSR
jgi:NNP family nitrate/nitrite transporter-like MFS transporter